MLSLLGGESCWLRAALLSPRLQAFHPHPTAARKQASTCTCTCACQHLPSRPNCGPFTWQGCANCLSFFFFLSLISCPSPLNNLPVPSLRLAQPSLYIPTKIATHSYADRLIHHHEFVASPIWQAYAQGSWRQRQCICHAQRLRGCR